MESVRWAEKQIKVEMKQVRPEPVNFSRVNPKLGLVPKGEHLGIFPGWMPFAQPTASKRWRKKYN